MTRRITDKEITQIVEKMKPEYATIALLSLETAMRTSEISTLNPCIDIDFENKRANLRNPKYGKPQSVYLSDKAIDLIKSINPLESGELFSINEENMLSSFSHAAKSLGINDISFTDIRHEAIYRLSKIMPIEELAQTIGHKVGLGQNDQHLRKYYE